MATLYVCPVCVSTMKRAVYGLPELTRSRSTAPVALESAALRALFSVLPLASNCRGEAPAGWAGAVPGRSSACAVQVPSAFCVARDSIVQPQYCCVVAFALMADILDPRGPLAEGAAECGAAHPAHISMQRRPAGAEREVISPDACRHRAPCASATQAAIP